MQKTIDLFNQLKNAGITPKLIINLPADTVDVNLVTQLQAELKKAGITPEIHVNLNLDTGDQGDSPPATPIDDQQTKPAVVSAPKTNCRAFTRMDKAGKPVMEIREPRVQLFQGDRFSVSATHKAGDKDTGDGTVIGTGGIKYYFVVDCPTNRDAQSLYVRDTEVTLV